jgi:hypothetical protein
VPGPVNYVGIGLFDLMASSFLVAVSEAPAWGWTPRTDAGLLRPGGGRRRRAALNALPHLD